MALGLEPASLACFCSPPHSPSSPRARLRPNAMVWVPSASGKRVLLPALSGSSCTPTPPSSCTRRARGRANAGRAHHGHHLHCSAPTLTARSLAEHCTGKEESIRKSSRRPADPSASFPSHARCLILPCARHPRDRALASLSLPMYVRLTLPMLGVARYLCDASRETDPARAQRHAEAGREAPRLRDDTAWHSTGRNTDLCREHG